MRAVEVSSPAEAVRKTLGTWDVRQSGWRSVAAKECFSCGARWRAWGDRRHALVGRASDDATARASGSRSRSRSNMWLGWNGTDGADGLSAPSVPSVHFFCLLNPLVFR